MATISNHDQAVSNAHCRLSEEMGPEDDDANSTSLGIILAADGCPEEAERYDVPLPKNMADPWVLRAIAIIKEEEAKLESPGSFETSRERSQRLHRGR